VTFAIDPRRWRGAGGRAKVVAVIASPSRIRSKIGGGPGKAGASTRLAAAPPFGGSPGSGGTGWKAGLGPGASASRERRSIRALLERGHRPARPPSVSSAGSSTSPLPGQVVWPPAGDRACSGVVPPAKKGDLGPLPFRQGQIRLLAAIVAAARRESAPRSGRCFRGRGRGMGAHQQPPVWKACRAGPPAVGMGRRSNQRIA